MRDNADNKLIEIITRLDLVVNNKITTLVQLFKDTVYSIVSIGYNEYAFSLA